MIGTWQGSWRHPPPQAWGKNMTRSFRWGSFGLPTIFWVQLILDLACIEARAALQREPGEKPVS
jgi:hypothetical protein